MSQINQPRLVELGIKAVQNKQWDSLFEIATQLLDSGQDSASAWFFLGIYYRAINQLQRAKQAFEATLKLDASRADSQVELAELELKTGSHDRAMRLLDQFSGRLGDNVYYLYKTAQLYSKLTLHKKAWPLYKKANELQPNSELINAGFAASAVAVGKTDVAKKLYSDLLQKKPDHQRYHYELSKIATATDFSHIEKMKAVLSHVNQQPEKNIFLYYALAKELEDQQQWAESFEYYKKGGDAARRMSVKAGYSLKNDLDLFKDAISHCSKQWCEDKLISPQTSQQPAPIFVTGLPRTGTTLVEKILSSHSQIETADESFFLPLAIKEASELLSKELMSSQILKSAVSKNLSGLQRAYVEKVRYRLSDKPFFVEKYPFNFFNLGFIAKAFSNAKIVLLKRNPMDACFAMYKQSYFEFAFCLNDLAEYYAAYQKLIDHWRDVLEDQLVIVEYEKLVSDPQNEIVSMLSVLGFEYESACLNFHQNDSASSTASASQIREKAHTRSINKWRKYESQLQPLADSLIAAGIQI